MYLTLHPLTLLIPQANPHDIILLRNWARVLKDQAKAKDRAEADRLFAQCYLKYHQVLAVKVRQACCVSCVCVVCRVSCVCRLVCGVCVSCMCLLYVSVPAARVSGCSYLCLSV